MENQAATAMQTEQHSQKGSPTGHGLTSQTVELTNEVFEFFKLNYPFFNMGLTDEQIKFKKMQWASRIQAHPADKVREAMNRTIESLDDKGGPNIANFMVHLNRSPAHKPFPTMPKLTDQSERAAAKQATQRAFVARFGDVMPKILTENFYDGDFPYQEVADAIAIPESPNLRDHQYAWSKLYEGFDAVWRHLHG